MLLSDLGDTDFAKHLKTHPTDATQLYSAAVDTLIHLDKAAPPAGLTTMTPQIGGEMVAITTEWYANNENEALSAEITTHLDRFCGPANTVALRDFHAENLIWRPSLQGTDRVGLLDYQDAFTAPRGYDLVRDGKTRYMRMIPHIWQMITEDLAHPDLKTLQKCVASALPTPENSAIKDLL